MDPLWIVAAFVFGAASSRIGLPPLVGIPNRRVCP